MTSNPVSAKLLFARSYPATPTPRASYARVRGRSRGTKGPRRPAAFPPPPFRRHPHCAARRSRRPGGRARSPGPRVGNHGIVSVSFPRVRAPASIVLAGDGSPSPRRHDVSPASYAARRADDDGAPRSGDYGADIPRIEPYVLRRSYRSTDARAVRSRLVWQSPRGHETTDGPLLFIHGVHGTFWVFTIRASLIVIDTVADGL